VFQEIRFSTLLDLVPRVVLQEGHLLGTCLHTTDFQLPTAYWRPLHRHIQHKTITPTRQPFADISPLHLTA
jgi:hypothetical protein